MGTRFWRMTAVAGWTSPLMVALALTWMPLVALFAWLSLPSAVRAVPPPAESRSPV